MLISKINQIVGVAPVGWEFVPYLLACVSFVLILSAVIKVLLLPLKFYRGGI